MKPFLAFLAGVATGCLALTMIVPHPTYTQTAKGWRVDHIPMPPCRDPGARWTALPAKDEAAFSVTCESK